MLWLPPAIGLQGHAAAGQRPRRSSTRSRSSTSSPRPTIPADVARRRRTRRRTKSGTKYVVRAAGHRQGEGALLRHRHVQLHRVGQRGPDVRLDGDAQAPATVAAVPPARGDGGDADVDDRGRARAVLGRRRRRWRSGGKPLPGMPTGALLRGRDARRSTKASTTPPPVPPDVAKPPGGREEDREGRVLQACSRPARAAPSRSRPTRVQRALHGLDDRRPDVRLVGDQGRAGGVLARRRDRRLDRRHPADVGRRQGAVLDPRGARVQGRARPAAGHAGVRRRAARDQAGGREGCARRRRRSRHGGAPAGIPAPPDVAAPPKDAKKSPTGVSYKVLDAPARAARSRPPTDTVKVHYTGWTTDGKMFDSSVHARPAGRVPAERRDRRLDRRHPADVGRRQGAVLDPRGARLQGPAGPPAGHAGVRRRAARDQAGG